MRHTAGLWKVDQRTQAIYAGDKLIAMMNPYEIHDFREVKANALLIESAPALIEACKLACKRLGDLHAYEGIESAETLRILIAAIALTEGNE